MEPGVPEAKRPRLTTGSSHSWSQLPPPTTSGPHHAPLPHPHHPPYTPHHPFARPGEHPPNPVPHHIDERRHHEPEQRLPPPIQDHHRHPPSPAHVSPYPMYARDVKPDPGEDMALPHMRRPNSTGNASDGLPPTPHALAHPPPDDPRRPTSFVDIPPPAPQYPPQSPAMHTYRPPGNYPHPPPTPVQQHPHYDHHGYAQAAPSPDVSYPSAIAHATAKRKAQRASQACDSCRQLKAKCDELKPCKNCKEKGIQCNYREPPAKQPDKVTADILDMMKEIKDQIAGDFTKMGHRIKQMDDGMNKRMKSWESRMSNLEKALHAEGAGDEVKMESVEGGVQNEVSSPAETAELPAEEEREEREEREYDRHSRHSSDRETNGEPAMTEEEVKKTLQEANEIEIEAHPGAPVEPGRPTMPANHTTLAGLLLDWPAIAELVGPVLEEEKISHVEEFPIHQEQQRGLLRVHGKGEGLDLEMRPSAKESHFDSIMTDVNDDFSDAPTPPPGEPWGQVGTLNDHTSYKGGPLNVDGTPDFDPHKVKKYVQSFKDNILNMHPILIPKELDALVAMFLQSLPAKADSEKPTSKPSSAAKFAVPTSAGTPAVETGTKRKRSPAADDHPPVPLLKSNLPFRSIHSAMVLSVLALGKICLHRDKIPDVVPEKDRPMQQNSPAVRNGMPASPLQGSPPGMIPQPPLSGLPSPKEHGRDLNSRRPSLQGAGVHAKAHSMKRNLDQIPGLEYFALVTDIIGSHVGGATLKHVYTWLFMGLYYGQLGRVMESWGCISNGCRTLAVCLRPSQDRLVRHTVEARKLDSKRDNQLSFAYWSCLQLESDILAELRLPQSMILSFEEQMPYPNLELAVGYSDSVMSSYSAQLYLRKQLNLIHELFYSPKTLQAQRESTEEKMQDMQMSLAHSRNQWVPLEYRWNDDDPPANNILAARLRAKFWGSQVILYRPFLDAVLHPEKSTQGLFAPQPMGPWEDPQVDLSNYPLPPNMDPSTFPRALNYARRGIRALVESTRAFHGLDPTKRFIVTNHFTTAHAQWGNLLCLAACYRHPILGQMLDKQTLAELFGRTMDFFKFIITSSSSLNADLRMLMEISSRLGLTKEDLAIGAASSSFSSMASGGPLPPMQHNMGDHMSPGTPTGPPGPGGFMPPPHSMPS